MHLLRGLVAVVAMLLVTGCVLPAALPRASDLELAPGTLLLIGKVELDPPLSPELEQSTHWNVIG